MMTIENDSFSEGNISNGNNLNLIKEIANGQVECFYSWKELKQAIIYKLSTIPVELDGKGAVQKCLNQLNYLIDCPFTIQRVCELISMMDDVSKTSNLSKECNLEVSDNMASYQYTNIDKYLNALYKCLNVNGACDDDKLLSISFNKMDTSQ